MQAIFETVFDIAYLATVVTLGVRLVRSSQGRSAVLLFGIMALVLGFGDAFHLIPRAYALNTAGLEANAALLGVGKLITSVTMTVFYVLLYYIARLRYRIQGKRWMDALMILLAVIRVALCLFPQNEWTSANAPLEWGIYRNIPFAAMGIFIIALYAVMVKRTGDRPFRFMALAVALSFAFYIPVVLFADAYSLIGMLMIPKTLAYVWVIVMGYRDSAAESSGYDVLSLGNDHHNSVNQ